MARIGKKARVVLICLAAIVGTLFLAVRESTVRARALHELSYKPAVQAIAALIPPGTTQEQAVTTLRRAGLPYRTQPDGKEALMLVSIARNPSGVWYCSFEDVYAAVHFHAGPQLDIPDDAVVQQVSEYRQLMECL